MEQGAPGTGDRVGGSQGRVVAGYALEGVGIGCSEGGAGAGGVIGSLWGIFLPGARVVMEFDVSLLSKDVLPSKDGVRNVQILALSCPFLPFSFYSPL